MKNYISLLQVLVSVAVIILVLLQQRGAALGSAFGQGEGFYATRRGAQQKIFLATIACGIIFLLLSIYNLLL